MVTKELHAAQPEFAKTITNRLNPTGRVITIPLPLKDGDTALGDISTRVSADDALQLSVADLRARLKGTLGGALTRNLEKLSTPSGFATLAELEAVGVRIVFDKGLQELRVEVLTDLRPTNDISIAQRAAPRTSPAVAPPARFSGYVNIISGFDYAWGADGVGLSGSPLNGVSQRYGFEGVTRMFGLVLENRALYEGNVDANVCPTGARCIYQHTSGFKRQSSRLVYDLPDSQMRLTLGDTDPLAAPVQRSVEMLGVSIEKSPYKLAPTEVTGAVGRTSLRLDRPSEVDVIVNGIVVQHLRLRPGTYNIRDLPLATGANEIKLAIVDDAGQRRTETFTTFGATNLLGEGRSEWAATAGVPSFLRDNERVYRSGDPMASSFFRYGINDWLTGDANVQADSRIAMGSIGARAASVLGSIGLYGAVSSSEVGTGLGGGLNWDLIGFTGLVADRAENLSLSAEYRGTNFRRPGDRYVTASGILFPEFNYWLRLGASYSTKLDDNMGLALSARYQFADDKRLALSPFTVRGDRYGTDLTLSRSLAPNITGSLLVGYSNESYLRPLTDLAMETRPDFRVAVRFSLRPDEKTSVTSSYDTLNRQSTASAYRSEGNGIGRWDTTVSAQHLGFTDTSNASASVGYYGNRGEVTVSHFADATGSITPGPGAAAIANRTSLRAGASIAFADGVVAVGPPIRGGAFAIVHPHESIAGREITVGAADYVRAKADAWGPAVVTDVPAYAPTSIPVDVADLPVGYSLGAAAFDLRGSYRAGHVLEVGSDYSVSAVGTLLDATGEPVALTSGTAHSRERTGKSVAVFTNGAGRFGADGLAPGRWIIEMASEPPLSFVIEIPGDVQGLFRAGTLRPIRGSMP